MCNLYSITKGQQAIRDLAGAMRDLTGNLPMLPGVFPDYSAPIVRTAVDGVRELAMARWGMPSPTFAIAGKKTDPRRHPHPQRRISPTGGDGSASKVAASSPLPASRLRPRLLAGGAGGSFAPNRRTSEQASCPTGFAAKGARIFASYILSTASGDAAHSVPPNLLKMLSPNSHAKFLSCPRDRD